MQEINSLLKNFLENAQTAIQQVLLLPNGDHPIWSDSIELVQLANQQMLQPLGVMPDERILACIGMHSQNVLTKSRQSIGFLITNFRILIQNDSTVFRTQQTADYQLLTQVQNPSELSNKVWNQFIIKNDLDIKSEQLESMKTAIEDVLAIILPQLQSLNYLPKELPKCNNIDDRIKELRLTDILKSYPKNEKLLKKFADKYNIINIKYGAIDKPFFGSPYGLVITSTGITSRDLMEECVISTWADILKHPASVSDKADQILAGGKLHTVPTFDKKAVPALIVLINELAKGQFKI